MDESAQIASRRLQREKACADHRCTSALAAPAGSGESDDIRVSPHPIGFGCFCCFCSCCFCCFCCFCCSVARHPSALLTCVHIHKMTRERVTIEIWVPMRRNSAPVYSLSGRTASELWQCGSLLCLLCATKRAHAYPVRLPHRLVRRHCCQGLLVRVEKLAGDLKRAELVVPSKNIVVLAS